jgi:peptidoglycan/LPS O-acetylase OafA/YrhL
MLLCGEIKCPLKSVIKPSNAYFLFCMKPVLLEFASGIWVYKILYRRHNTILYTLYLTHTFMIITFSKLVLDIDGKITIVSVIASALAVAIAVGVAYFSWYVIENKLTKWIKIKLEK